MEKLLKNKLEAAKELKAFTLDIKGLSLKTDFNKVNSMIEKRQQFIDKINAIDDRICQEKNIKNYIESDEIKKLNKDLLQVFVEIYEIDNIIRKNISNELKTVKEKLNHPESLKVLNIKA